MDQMGHQEMTAMSTTAASMVPTRFAPLRSRWGAILMVRLLYFSAWLFLQNLISSCELSTCPREAHVPTLFYSQRPRRTPNTWRNRDRVSKATTGWQGWRQIPEEAWKIIREHQEGVPRSASSCCCKWNPSRLSLLATNNLMTGAMGPGEVRANGYEMGRHMRPAIWRSRKARIQGDARLYAPHWHFVEDPRVQWYQAASDEDGHWQNWGSS